MSQNKKPYTLSKNILTLLVTIAVVLTLVGGVGEVILRKQYSENDHYPQREGEIRKSCVKGSGDVLYEFDPTCNHINSEGFIDHEYPLQKKNGTYRIIVIGDSIAQGHGVDVYSESFPKVLEKKLNENIDKPHYEVLTMAVTGYSTSQELKVLEDKALKYDSDLIVWSYVLNDPSHPVFHDANGGRGDYFADPKLHVTQYFRKKIFYIKERIIADKKECPEEFHKFAHCVYWKDIKGNIAGINKLASREEAEVLFMIHPVFKASDFQEGYGYDTEHEKLSREARKNGFYVLDILEAYQPYEVSELKLSPDDPWHPNARGHEIVAEELFKKIKWISK
ncbi:MAG: SGNH/GDSL hydrolase family protein [Candidatus Woesearchaeota archaeon]